MTATAGNIAVGKTLDLATLLSSNSDGAYTYALASAPSEATYTLTGSSFTAETVGNYTISITQAATDTYKQASVNVVVTVVDRNWELVSIAIIVPPAKTIYDAGECFNPEGMVVQATYAATDDAGYTKKVDETSKILYPLEALQPGTTAVDISFGGKSVSEAITVTEFEWRLMQIEVTTPPAKTEYKDGESFDPTGMVVTATYSEVNDKAADKTEDVTSRCTFSPNPLTLETTAVTISFGEETTTQAVTVVSSVASVGTVMWEETWTNGKTNDTPGNYNKVGTTVYGGYTVTYSSSNNDTKLFNDTLSTGLNLLLKPKDTWKIEGIPTGNASSLTFTFETNNNTTTRYQLSTDTEGVEIGTVKVTGSASPYTVTSTITVNGSADKFNLLIYNSTSKNVRLDNLKIVVAE